MTPKEKAKSIFDKMYQVDDIMGNYPMCFDTAKKCAIIAVEEIISNDNSKDLTVMMYFIDVKKELIILRIENTK
jgi:hypothetical protein